jgi:cobalt/nickel transport system permease protein
MYNPYMLFTHPLSPQAMHLPDGFLSLLVACIFWILSVVIIGIALRQTKKTLGERQVPLMGVLAAAIFAGQMLNFTVAGGTSGHLLGAAIATILLGPWPAMLVMTAVVAIQALLFQDGGLLALGANLFNMAIVGVLVSHAVFNGLGKLLKKRNWGVLAAGFLAAWASIFIAALACGLELSLSGTSPANIAVPAMGAIHALIGIGEGLITLGALVLVRSARSDLLHAGAEQPADNKIIIIAGGALALLLVILSPLASTYPDGLEWVAEQQGFLDSAQGMLYEFLPDYTLPGITNPVLTTIAAGVIGIIIVFGVLWLFGRPGKRNPPKDQ